MVGAFGGKVWWGNLRIVHAINYLLFVAMSYHEVNYAYLPLLFDVMVSLAGFLGYRTVTDGLLSWVVDRGGLIKPIIGN